MIEESGVRFEIFVIPKFPSKPFSMGGALPIDQANACSKMGKK
jgi:hypothetical protein